MNAKINDGGPAFPVPDSDSRGYVECSHIGMTLRDYFAAKLMHAEVMTCCVPGGACDALVEACGRTGEKPEDHMARCAYEMADAMLKAREVQP
jgi:hypothetical protein